MVPGARLVILGKQGAGKGTQCVRLARHYVVPHISTGDMLRAAARSGTEFGRRAKEFMDSGELVPDEVMVGLIKERLDYEDTKFRGFVLDGFPAPTSRPRRSPTCWRLATSTWRSTSSCRRKPRWHASPAGAVCNVCGAIYSAAAPPKYDWTCDFCGGEVVQREDDTEEAIARRLALYEEATAPLIAWYLARDMLVTVDGIGARRGVPSPVPCHRRPPPVKEPRAPERASGEGQNHRGRWGRGPVLAAELGLGPRRGSKTHRGRWGRGPVLAAELGLGPRRGSKQ